MPRILGMEPEQWKPLAIVAGGGLALFLVLRSRSGAPVDAAAAPSLSPMVSQAPVSSPGAQEVGQAALEAQGLQNQRYQAETQMEQAMGALQIRSQLQQQQFQAQVGAEELHQMQEQTYALYRANRPKSGGGLTGWLNRVVGSPQQISQYADVGRKIAGMV